MGYLDDNAFSTIKDIQVKEYLETKLHWKCELIDDPVQQKAGVDMVVHAGSSVFNVDNKHIRGTYTNFYLETESCPASHTPGWVLKEDSKTDFVFYIYWDGDHGTLWAFKLKDIREWFKTNRHKCWRHQNDTLNATVGYNARIVDVHKDIFCRKIEIGGTNGTEKEAI